MQSRLAPTGYNVDVSNFRTTPVSQTCWGNVPQHPDSVGGGSRALLVLQQSTAADRPTSTPEGDLPTVLSLSRAYPNPVRSGVTMDLAVPEGRTGRYVLEVYDVRGRRILQSVREVAASGRYKVAWGARDSRGTRAAAGVYFLKLSGPEGFVETRKVTLLR